jgi:hypothetical protein
MLGFLPAEPGKISEKFGNQLVLQGLLVLHRLSALTRSAPICNKTFAKNNALEKRPLWPKENEGGDTPAVPVQTLSAKCTATSVALQRAAAAAGVVR